MRVRLRGPLFELELRPWTELELDRAYAERLRPRDELEARALLRNVASDAGWFSIRALLFELEPGFVGHQRDDELLIRLARLIVRGLIVVERRPIALMASEAALRIERQEFEPRENEFEEEIKVAHGLELDEPPLVAYDSEPDPLPIVVFYAEVEPPPLVIFDSEPEPGPVIAYSGESSGP